MAARPLLAAALAAASTLLAVTGCSSSGPAHPGTIDVVASTDVYADIVSAVGGRFVSVTSFVDDPSQDPHSYEANARNQLAVSRAQLIVENGGGYDDFMDRMRSATGKQSTPLINVVALSGRSGPNLNEHVWYDFPTVARFVQTLTTTLTTAQPGHRAAFAANAERFTAGLTALEQTEAAIKARDHGAGVAITEPVPLYLLTACGLVNRTPAAFSQDVEAGNDVPARVLQQTVALFTDKQVRALVYNEQTSGPATTAVIDAAKAAGIPAVPVTETLPTGDSYLGWMRANLAAVQAAVQGGTTP